MKLMELLQEGEVIPFPSPKAKKELDRLLANKITDEVKKDKTIFLKLWNELENYIMDEKNPMSYRIKALKKLDQLIGEVQSSYSAKDVEKYIKEIEQEKREMYESKELSNGLTQSGKERVERAVRLFTNMLKDNPDANVKNVKNAAIKMAHIEIYSGAEMNKVEEEFEKILKGLKKEK